MLVNSQLLNDRLPLLYSVAANYDFTNSQFLTLSGTAITQALDRSGNNAHTAVQATATRRPTFASGQVNGLPAATFDGGDLLVCPSALHNIANTANTIFAVAQVNTQGAGVRNIISSYTGSFAPYFLQFAANRVGFKSRNGAGSQVSSTTFTSTAYGIVHGRRTGTTQFVQRNNSATQGTNALGADSTTMTTLYIGAFPNGPSEFHNGGIAEIIMYRRLLTTNELLLVYRYFSKKYNITIG